MNLFFARSTTPANAKRSHRKRATHEGRRPTLLTKLLAVIAAAFAMQGLVAMTAARAVLAPVGNGFTVSAGDLSFLLKQIKIAERHATTLTASNPCGTLLAQPGDPIPDAEQVPDILTSYGLRSVDGSCNNLKDATTRNFAASDQVFPRLTSPVFRDAEDASLFGGPVASSYAQKTGNVADSQPRTVSNLIDDQTSTNPAAIAAAGSPVRSQDPTPTAVVCTAPNTPVGCTPEHKTLFIPNITTDVGLSPPFNSVFTFFGQFFDHGVDQTVKSGSTVFIPLKADDPLRTLGPDGVAGTGDEVPANQAFMVLTRAQNQPGPDGILGTPDDVQDATNTDTPWVDQSQTYASHASHQVFLREYTKDAAGHPVSTGRFLGGVFPVPAPDASGTIPDTGISTWATTKAQAKEML